jgi:DNA (cytosine-5)-methyltransferase 1
MDLCSGIGGGRLGLELAGLKSIGFSDTSGLAVKTYQQMHNAEDEKNYGNLKFIKGEHLPRFDMLIAGFPCQTFSVIGRQDGFSDDRGQIIFQIARILKETQPVCFLLENVKGLVTHDNGKTIKIITKELNNVGYDVTYKVLSSIAYGVPQMRQRVYFIGFRKGIAKDINKFYWPEVIDKPNLRDFLIDDNATSDEQLKILQYYLNNPTNKGKYTLDDIKKMEGKIIDTRMSDLRIYEGRCPTLRAQRDGILYIRNGVVYNLTGYEALLLQGFPQEYAMRVKGKVSDRHLLMQAGNAMTVNVIKALADSIISFLEQHDLRENRTMTKWEDFEIDCTEYLKRKFHQYANFKLIGGSDSTLSDIKVSTDSGDVFYIEAKQSKAQCGQFVLLPNIETRTFTYSNDNKTSINSYAIKIMEHMNAQFDEFKEAGTTGKDITFDNDTDVFINWIVEIYKNKCVRYFITNNYVIFPIEKFSEYFNIKAKYRIKRSGSSDVGKSNIANVLNYIQSNSKAIKSSRTYGAKLFITSSESLHNKKFIFNSNEYMISERGSEYEIRKLSNTFNANVIFSIELKTNKIGIEDDEFIEALKQ